MTEYFMEERQLEQFRQMLEEEERSRRTVEKYLRDVRAFLRQLGEDGRISKACVIRYKERLLEITRQTFRKMEKQCHQRRKLSGSPACVFFCTAAGAAFRPDQ